MRSASSSLAVAASATLALALALAAGCTGSTGYKPYRGPELAIVADNVAARVERIRGQPLRDLVLVEEVPRTALQSFVRERLMHGSSRDLLERQAVAFARLGLFPESNDPLADNEAVLLGHMVGFYDPVRSRLGLVHPSLERGQVEVGLARELLLAHELTHALQDQRGGLYGMMDAALVTSSDRHLATMAVIEGEAQAVMYDYLLAGSGKGIGDVRGRLGDALIGGPESNVTRGLFGREGDEGDPLAARALVFPYYAGATFIQEVYRHGGWQAVDRLFADLPVLSSEQVLHPAKYLDNADLPVTLELPEAPALSAGGWVPYHQDVVGEFGMRMLLERTLGSEEAVAAAIGWDGDRLEVSRNASQQLAYRWGSVWDSDEQAAEAFAAFQRSVPLRLGGAELLATSEEPGLVWARWRARPGIVYGAQQGTSVMILEGFSDELTDILAATALDMRGHHEPADRDRGRGDALSSREAEQAANGDLELSPAARHLPEINGNTLHDERYHFRISRPSAKRWHFVPARPGAVRRARLQRLDDLDNDQLLASRYAGVEVITLGLPLNLEQIARQTERQLAFALGSFKKLSEERRQFADHDAVELQYRGTLGGVAMRFRQIILIADGNQLVLTAASTVGTYEQDYPDLDAILASFSFE